VTTTASQHRKELEARLGYRFAAAGLLDRALTHPSAVSDRGAGQLDSYQRLEFLGDRVLGLVVADLLMEAFPGADEGELHRRHASLVRKETCAEVGSELGLGDAVRLGEGEENSGGREKLTILGDACEAVIGAIYVDGGLEPARALIERCWRSRIAGPSRPPRDAKSTLQEWAQAQGLRVPVYRVTGESGPAHAPRFVVTAEVDGKSAAVGAGASKREAEQEAAATLLVREGIWSADRR
jgi:ribonuclease-3